jgi:ribonucleoside-triphosphate reductase
MCDRVYCSSHSLEYLKKYGLSLSNAATESLPSNRARTLTGHLNTFLSSIQTYYAGALGLAYLNMFYAPLLISLTPEQIRHEAQYLIFSLSQNAFSRGSQSLFIDANIDLAVPHFFKEVPCIVKGGMYCTEFDFENIEKDPDKWLHKRNDDFRKCFWVYHKEKKKATKRDLIKHLKDIGRTKLVDKVEESEMSSKILTFGDFEDQMQQFAKALMEVWLEGDKTGKIFPFPKFQCHINEETFKDEKQKELFDFACKLSADKGITNFVFDRGKEITLSQCCRLKETLTDMTMVESPETLRMCGFQNISINLPQSAYRAKGDFDKTIREIKSCMDLAMQAHIQKKKFISLLMDHEDKPLWQIGKNGPDGKPYVDLEKATYIIGIVGLNECIQHITGKELHESDDSYKMGLKIITNMYLYCKELAKEYKLKVVLEESPAESTSPRFAKIDSKTFSESKKYIKGNQKTGDTYYTNSIHFSASAPIDIIKRIEGQSKFSQLIEAGSITHVFLGEQKITKESIFNLVEKTYYNTTCAQLTISPELIFCETCGHLERGFNFLNEEEEE